MGATQVYDAARNNSWTTHLARVGLAAKGFVYVMIGILAIQVARGERGEATAARGALQSLADEPLGTFLLAAIGIGLFGYAFWRIVQGISPTSFRVVIAIEEIPAEIPDEGVAVPLRIEMAPSQRRT